MGKVRLLFPLLEQCDQRANIAQEDIGLDAYYWQAPPQYLGNKLISYGQMLTVHTSWHTGRGDTSGTPTREPDVILEGGGFRIGYGTSNYRASDERASLFLQRGHRSRAVGL